MDESDSELDAPGMYDDGDRYPLEGKFVDEADKAEIMAMPEIKREELLAERAQEVERDRQNRALRQLLNAREAESKKQDKKRKAGTADLDENQRKTSRQRTKLGGGKVGESSTGIDSLKRARAEKNDRQRRRDEDKERNKDRRSHHEEYSDVDADGESEVEWDDGRSKNKKSQSPDYRDAEPAGLHDIERVRVGRSRFAMVCFYPGFDEAITGCFVRISVGIDKETNQNIYRMAVIKGMYGMFQYFIFMLTLWKALLKIDHMPLRRPMGSTSRPHNTYERPTAKQRGTGHSLLALILPSPRFVYLDLYADEHDADPTG
jgi:RNA polymerase-associated protein RTF1